MAETAVAAAKTGVATVETVVSTVEAVFLLSVAYGDMEPLWQP